MCRMEAEALVEALDVGSGAQWGSARHDRAQKRGSPLRATPRLNTGLLVEAAAEPVLHPTGERSARALGSLLAWPARLSPATIAAGYPRARDGEDHAAEHHQEADHRQNRKAANHGGLEGDTANQ